MACKKQTATENAMKSALVWRETSSSGKFPDTVSANSDTLMLNPDD